MTSASKVGDLFTAAGEAFSKLAELTCLLQTPINNGGTYGDNAENSGWSANDTELLRLAVKRFGDELNVISEHIKDKTMCQIKSTFKKIQPSLSNSTKSEEDSSRSGTADDSALTSSGVGRIATATATGSGGGGGGGVVVGTVTTERLPGMSAISPVNETLSGSVASGGGTASSSTTSTIPLQTAMTLSTANTTTSICPSPSPFLHYPLLRKSADITLNMLNARDDSDDEDRMGLSVFNSV